MDWHSLLHSISTNLRESSSPPDDFWEHFVELAQHSEHAGALSSLLRYGSRLPPSTRLLIVTSVAHLLENIDWPEHFNSSRLALVSSMEALVAASDVDDEASLASRLGIHDDSDFAAWLVVFKKSVGLLSKPCPRTELATVAQLSNMSMNRCLLIYRKKLARSELVSHPKVFDAKFMFEIAYMGYGLNARRFNSVAGAVLFSVVEQPLHEV